MSEFAKRGAASEEAKRRAEQGFTRLLQGYTEHEVFLWRQNFGVMVRAVEEKRDTVWGFILKNAYRPAYLRRQKVAYIVANPPWLSLRDIKDKAYKLKIKELTFRYKLLGKAERNLFTQIDTSTVFFAHAGHEFLRVGGTMAFVMPKSVILPAKQHLAFQRMGFTGIHEFGAVEGLFKVPTCVLIRDDNALVEKIPLTHWSGDLSRGQRNIPLGKAREILQSSKTVSSFLVGGPPRSPYFPHVLQGASIVPRSLWFVEPPPDQPINPKSPFLRTAKSVKVTAKKPWKKLDIRGKVEKDFLFGTALAEDLLPFAIRKLRLVVLPSKEKDKHLIMFKPDDILAEGAPLASDWVRTAEKIWDRRRTDKTQSAYDRLNYDGLLSRQNPREKFTVVYNRSGTNLIAAYVSAAERKNIGALAIQGFVTDFIMYRYPADTEDHALYLVGVLNTSVVNDAIKPWQTQGIKGERDIARRPFEVCPIPIFDPQNNLHSQIVEIAREARKKMLEWRLRIEGSTTLARRTAKRVIQPELDKLDKLVRELLNDHRLGPDNAGHKVSRTPSLFAAVENH